MADGLTIHIEGRPATVERLAPLALVNYGCFTSMLAEPVEGGWGVRGLDLHLERLLAGGVELFGVAPDPDRIRDFCRTALEGRAGPASLRVNLFHPAIKVRDPSARAAPKVMVTVSPPPEPATTPLHLALTQHERQSAHLKHVATFDLVQRRRAAMHDGFDDVLFATADGRVSEGATWSIGFIAGETVVWPEAPMLPGVAQAVVERNLATVGLSSQTRVVAVDELAAFDGAFVTNALTPPRAVAEIAGRPFADNAAMIDRLRAARDHETPAPL